MNISGDILTDSICDRKKIMSSKFVEIHREKFCGYNRAADSNGNQILLALLLFMWKTKQSFA